VGLLALQRMSHDDLRHVVRALSTQDARTMVQEVAAGGSADLVCCFDGVWSRWDEAERLSPADPDGWRDALALYVTVSREAGLSGPAVVVAARALLRLATLRESEREASSSLLAALTDGDLAALHRTVGTSDAEILAPLTRCPPEWIRAVHRDLAGRDLARTEGEPKEAGRRYTSFGGVFLLLPILDEAPIPAATSGWPDADDVEPACLIRYLLYVLCCGSERSVRAFADPLLRDLFRVASSLSIDELVVWQERLSQQELEEFTHVLRGWQHVHASGVEQTPADVDYLTLPPGLPLRDSLSEALRFAACAVIRSLARRLPGFTSSTFPYLYSNFLDMTASLEEEGERRVVRLGRPPLSVILSINTMSRSAYRLSWLDDRPFTLFPEE
jgi:hypothetical protein